MKEIDGQKAATEGEKKILEMREKGLLVLCLSF